MRIGGPSWEPESGCLGGSQGGLDLSGVWVGARGRESVGGGKFGVIWGVGYCGEPVCLRCEDQKRDPSSA